VTASVTSPFDSARPLSYILQIVDGGAEIASTGKRKYGKRKYTCNSVNRPTKKIIVEITMELPLLVE